MHSKKRILGLAALLLGFTTAQAALDISDKPLIAASSVPPNLVFMMDDSGSMAWSFMPDQISWRCNNNTDQTNRALGRSPDFNDMYYNPDVVYEPPIDSAGIQLPDADFNNAWKDGYVAWAGGTTDTFDLASEFRATWEYQDGGGNQYCGASGAADYYRYDTSCGTATDPDCYDRTVVPADQRQNFANWYSYYRYRMASARAGIGRAFTAIPETMRVGWGEINTGSTTVDGSTQRSVIQGVRAFTGTHKEAFYSFMYDDVQPVGNTPLRQALKGAGDYFENETATGPWSTTPGASDGQLVACRQSYTVLMTDGYWTNNTFSLGNSDNTAVSPAIENDTPNADVTSYAYTPGNPFNDEHDNTLADVAMEYWKRDLAENIDNKVPVSDENPAFWQHMVTYTVGLGVFGTINPDDAFAAIDDDTISIDWPDPTASNPGRIDDLLHAAVNSRGGFFSATDPAEFAAELANVITEIVARGTSLSSSTETGAAATATIQGLAFQTQYNPGDWSGDVLQVNASDGTLRLKASDELPAPADRNMFTDGDDFDTGMPASLKSLINADADTADNIINFVRGQDITGYRNSRPHPIGAVINSDPVVYRPQTFGWRISSPSYDDYVASKDVADSTVFVGTSGGALHGFDAQSMVETSAYVPRAVLGKLETLTDDENFEHEFFVDGGMNVRDAVINGNWATVLVGSLGAGGKGVFALDITNPSNPTLLWEVTSTDTGFENLGFSFSTPTVARVKTTSGDFEWKAVFGNGYGGADHKAYFYVVDLATGDLERTVAMGSEGAEPAPNGLSSPRVAAIQRGSDQEHHRWAYAGDLYGNLWRVDLSDTSTSESTPILNSDRPITATPQVGLIAGTKFAVAVGTGKLFETNDNQIPSNPPLERFYLIIDHPLTEAPLGRTESNLQLASSNNGIAEINTEDHATGWYRLMEEGEKVLEQATFLESRLFWTTYRPVTDPCDPGGVVATYGVLPLTSAAGIGVLGQTDPFKLKIEDENIYGPPREPAIVYTPDGAFVRNDGGTLEQIREYDGTDATSPVTGVRFNWRQLK